MQHSYHLSLASYFSKETNDTAEYELLGHQDLQEKELLLQEFLASYSKEIAFDHPKIDGMYTDFIVVGKHGDEQGKLTIKMDAMGAGDEMPRFSYICASKMGASKK